MWTALVIFAVISLLIGLLIYNAKKRGKLEERNKANEIIFDDLEKAKDIDLNLDNLSSAAKRILLKERNKRHVPSDDTN